MRAGLLVVILVAACGGDDGGNGTPDASADAFQSACGNPGDPGNELGVGQFCASQSECATTQSAPLCSSLGDPDTHFCTKTCPMGSTDACGTGAECTCNASNQCGCTPNTCLN